MLLVISPAKSLNYNIDISKIDIANLTVPRFIEDSKNLVKEMQKLSVDELGKLLNISNKLAMLNYQRFQEFSVPFNAANSKPALFVFDGDVYKGIDVKNYKKSDLDFAQKHLRILSGLYGCLLPLDLMQPYRLEMGIFLKNSRGKNLYEFWQEKITKYFNDEIVKDSEKVILNLASEEYFEAIDAKKINGRIINIVFKEKKGDKYKIVGLFAKRARGLMTNYIIKNKITKVSDIKKFDIAKYKFSKELSDENNWCFYR